MNPFQYSRAGTVGEAVVQVSNDPAAAFLAGGTTQIDLMKEDVLHPSRLIDINDLPLARIVVKAGGGVMIGAMVRNSDLAHSALIRESYPVLSEALLSGASAQLRNMATTAGNLMQRTRCPYFRDTATPCNKRVPGSGCPAREGYNRTHAIFGASEQCVAVHPSDMCVAMAALDAIVHTRGPRGARAIPIAEFHRLPGSHPEQDTILQHGELITEVELPASQFAGRSHYVKVRDRASYAFALVSAAVALHIEGNTIRAARVVLGSVAHKPWRSEAAEAVLIGAPATGTTFAAAGEAAVRDAQVLTHNAYKVALARNAVIRALTDVSA